MSNRDRKLLEKDWSRIRGSMQGLQSRDKSFGIMRTAKIKTLGNMGASLQHTFRERETPNADGERLKDNTILLGGASSKEVLAAWHKRASDKIRTNAVHGLEYFIGGSPERVQRVHGLLKTDGAVELPERLRGPLLRGSESDAAWRARATQDATDRVRALLLEMSDMQRSTETKLTLANQLIEKLEELVEVTRDDLGATRTQLTDTRDILLCLKSGLELAGLGKETNAAIKTYDKIEQQVLDGDLSLLKDAAGSELKMDRIAEIYDRLLPPEAMLTEEQQRFERALDTTVEATAHGRATKQKDPMRVTVETHALPHIRQALAKLAEDQTASPFDTQAERTAFRSEIESCLQEGHLDALRDGNAEVLAPILGDWLEEAEQLRLALAYYQHADVEVPHDVLRSVADRLADVEVQETHTHRDTGLAH